MSRGGRDPGFETVKLSTREVRLRARPRPLDSSESPAVSPTMIVTLRDRPWGTEVHGRFVRASSWAESAMELTRTTLTLLLVTGLLTTCGLIAWPELAVAGVVAYALASVATLGLCLRVLTSPFRAGMREYGPALRGLAGELLVPHALPEVDGSADPFRLGELERRRLDLDTKP
ncbi:hypothetical protein ENSA5_51290 [Enhygromyxa salina]|uniref:Uncharacterized protein n=2 Tax=Enhygromyxa salina TaxID=215803 RepID=A0A2S9XHG5_9BACT|nr:hypothetical protein ENSA5_51290 [Enhygromyxa salina]